MGSGSSRSGRALRRLRGPDSRRAGPGGAAPEGGTRPLASATAAAAREEAREAEAEAAERAADPGPGPGPGPGPAAPPDGGDETLRLLDQLLAESAAWGPGELAPAGPGAAPTRSRRPEPGALKTERQRAPRGQQHLQGRTLDGSPRRPERQPGTSVISYDYSEEELMASIEQEYCR
ncbi:Cys1 [Vulpes lagopus]